MGTKRTDRNRRQAKLCGRWSHLADNASVVSLSTGFTAIQPIPYAHIPATTDGPSWSYGHLDLALCLSGTCHKYLTSARVRLVCPSSRACSSTRTVGSLLLGSSLFSFDQRAHRCNKQNQLFPTKPYVYLRTYVLDDKVHNPAMTPPLKSSPGIKMRDGAVRPPWPWSLQQLDKTESQRVAQGPGLLQPAALPNSLDCNLVLGIPWSSQPCQGNMGCINLNVRPAARLQTPVVQSVRISKALCHQPRRRAIDAADSASQPNSKSIAVAHTRARLPPDA